MAIIKIYYYLLVLVKNYEGRLMAGLSRFLKWILCDSPCTSLDAHGISIVNKIQLCNML